MHFARRDALRADENEAFHLLDATHRNQNRNNPLESRTQIQRGGAGAQRLPRRPNSRTDIFILKGAMYIELACFIVLFDLIHSCIVPFSINTS